MLHTFTVNGRTYQRTAWTGGDRPPTVATYGRDSNMPTAEGERYHLVMTSDGADLNDTARTFNTIRCQLYREQLTDWQSYWGDLPNLDTRLIFWGRATYDAWRTITDGGL